jgi:glycosyltransferase involved in cell wall biosynthesis
MIKLSVITINLNAKVNLQKTIESVVVQEFDNYELIVIDGGSTDGSIDVIKQFENKITYWISEPDSGIYNAMNKGILHSKGEYCFFLNSGDFLVDKYVFSKVFYTNPSEDILFGNLYVTVGDRVIGKILGKKYLLFSDVYANIVKHQASFIRRDLFEKFGLYNETRRIIADWEFFIKTLGIGAASYRHVDTYISYFDNTGISNQSEMVTKAEKEQVIKENIPPMMRGDFDYLYRYKRYEKVFTRRIPFFLLRIMNKLVN